MRYIRFFSIEGDKFTNVNVFKRKLTIEEMKEITAGEKCGMEGDYLAWSNMTIRTKGVEYYNYDTEEREPIPVLVTNITIKQLCRQGAYTEVKAEGRLKFFETDKLCKKMGNSFIFTPISLEHEKNNTLRGSNYWIGIHDIAEEGVWRRHDNGELVNYTNWRPGQPNGGKDDTEDVVRGGWKYQWFDQTTDNSRNHIVCVNYEQPIYRLRGLCPETDFNVLFAPFNYGHADGSNDMVYHSFYFGKQTIITYNSTSSSWYMSVLSQSGNYTNATALGGKF